MQVPFSSSLLLPFESLANRVIAADPNLSERVSRLAGKTLLVEVSTPRLGIVVRFYPASISLAAHQPDSTDQDSQALQPDGTITGSATTLLGLLKRSAAKPLVNPGLKISGDVEFVQAVYDLFLDLEVDWQEPLSRFVGDVPVHALERFIQELSGFARQTSSSIVRNVDEYLHEEAQLVPPLNRVQAFDQDLDALRLRIDRIDARLAQLQQRLAPDQDS